MLAGLNLHSVVWTGEVPLHPFPLRLVFERNLHFIAVLEKVSEKRHRSHNAAS